MAKSKKSKSQSSNSNSIPLPPKPTPSKISKPPPAAPASTPTAKPSSKPQIDKTREIRFTENVESDRPVRHIIPLAKYESALNCCGSFLEHFTLNNTTPQGLDSQDLLMELLEPLLGKKFAYRDFHLSVNNYMQRQAYRTGRAELTENIKRYVKVASEKWKINRPQGGKS